MASKSETVADSNSDLQVARMLGCKRLSMSGSNTLHYLVLGFHVGYNINTLNFRDGVLLHIVQAQTSATFSQGSRLPCLRG